MGGETPVHMRSSSSLRLSRSCVPLQSAKNSPFRHCVRHLAMGNYYEWVAIALLGLVCLCQSQAAEATETRPPAGFNARDVFDRHSADGYSLTEEQFWSALEDYQDYVQDPNIALVKELMLAYDSDGNGQLELPEFQNLSDFLTKKRN